MPNDIPKTLRVEAHILLWEKEHDLEATMRELHTLWARETAYINATNKDALIKNILLCRGSWAQQQVNLDCQRKASETILERTIKARVDKAELDLANANLKLEAQEDVNSSLRSQLRETEQNLHTKELEYRDVQIELIRLQAGVSAPAETRDPITV